MPKFKVKILAEYMVEAESTPDATLKYNPTLAAVKENMDLTCIQVTRIEERKKDEDLRNL